MHLKWKSPASTTTTISCLNSFIKIIIFNDEDIRAWNHFVLIFHHIQWRGNIRVKSRRWYFPLVTLRVLRTRRRMTPYLRWPGGPAVEDYLVDHYNYFCYYYFQNRWLLLFKIIFMKCLKSLLFIWGLFWKNIASVHAVSTPSKSGVTTSVAIQAEMSVSGREKNEDVDRTAPAMLSTSERYVRIFTQTRWLDDDGFTCGLLLPSVREETSCVCLFHLPCQGFPRTGVSLSAGTAVGNLLSVRPRRAGGYLGTRGHEERQQQPERF